jgi:hypothetical protein
MRYLYVIILFIAINLPGTVANAQNLVPNPGFDINTGCPDQINQVDKADGWSTWAITPDYYHACSNITSPMFGTPSNNRGFQVPHSGDAYIGLFTHSSSSPNMREYVGRELSQPLVAGQTYYVSLWVNHADIDLGSHSSNGIGVRFSTVGYSLFDQDTALNNAHVFSTAVITDTAAWVQVQGTFIADSAYTHIGIGNYFDSANTTVIQGAPTAGYAYYLVDDVCVSTDSLDCIVATGIFNEPEMDKLIAFPNPTNGKFLIKGILSDDARIEIFNRLGKIIMDERVNPSNPKEFNLTGFATGIYIIKVTEANAVFYSGIVLTD